MKEVYVIRSLNGLFWSNIHDFSDWEHATQFETMWELMDCLKDAIESFPCEIITIYKW